MIPLNNNFSHDFIWRKKFPLHIAALQPTDKRQLSEGLKLMSAESIRNRFLASKKEFTEKELTYLTELDGENHFAIGIAEANRYKRGVGVVRLVRSADDRQLAEVAITLIDEYQRIGLGTLLMDLIILAAKEKEITKLSFTYLPQNEGMIKLIHKFGSPLKGRSNIDFEEVFLELRLIDISAIKNRLKEIMLLV